MEPDKSAIEQDEVVWNEASPLSDLLGFDLGADVVKVERPDAPDDCRSWGPPFLEGESQVQLMVLSKMSPVALEEDSLMNVSIHISTRVTT